MLMSGPSAQCLPHEVSITFQTWTYDLDGGRMVASAITRYGYPCAIHPGEPKTQVEDDRATGLRRVTHMIPFTIIFGENPRLNVHDLVTWIDDADPEQTLGHTIVVTGFRNASGRGSAWEVLGEERI